MNIVDFKKEEKGEFNIKVCWNNKEPSLYIGVKDFAYTEQGMIALSCRGMIEGEGAWEKIDYLINPLETSEIEVIR